MADVLLLIGFALLVTGVALWSVPAALIVAGVCLIAASAQWGQKGGAA